MQQKRAACRERSSVICHGQQCHDRSHARKYTCFTFIPTEYRAKERLREGYKAKNIFFFSFEEDEVEIVGVRGPFSCLCTTVGVTRGKMC